MRYPNEEIEAYRRNAGELENELIDEYRAGTLSRKELIQRGSVLGMSPCSSGCSPVRLRLRSPGRWRGRWTSASVAAQSASARRRSTRRWSRRCSRRWPPSASPRSPASSSRSPTRTPSCGRAWRPRGSQVAEGGLDLPDSTTRPLPGREADDGRRRRRDLQATSSGRTRRRCRRTRASFARYERSVATPCASTSRRRTGSFRTSRLR